MFFKKKFTKYKVGCYDDNVMLQFMSKRCPITIIYFAIIFKRYDYQLQCKIRLIKICNIKRLATTSINDF